MASSEGAPRVILQLRLMVDLYQAIRSMAKDEARSLNGQMNALLREALERRTNRVREKDSTQE